MKLNKIKRLVKAEGRCILYTEHTPEGVYRRQWIGTGSSLYLLEGMPQLTTENMPTLLGLEGAALEKVKISADALPEDIYTGDYIAEEAALLALPYVVSVGGRALELFRTGFQVWALDAEELAPAYGKNPKVSLRWREDGTPYFAVVDGLFLKGILLKEHGSAMDKVSEDGLALWLNWLGANKPEEAGTENDNADEV